MRLINAGEIRKALSALPFLPSPHFHKLCDSITKKYFMQSFYRNYALFLYGMKISLSSSENFAKNILLNRLFFGLIYIFFYIFK